MAIVTTDNQHYTDIAAAIRSKNGTETLYKPSEMAAAIQAISGGGEPEPPDDGKTRLYITVPANAMEGLPPPRNQVPLYIQQTVANGVTIDWGDGTAPETLPGTGAVNTKHAYEQAGDYVISLDPADGCELGLGANSSSYCVMGSSGDYQRVYKNMLRKVYIGGNITIIGRNAFDYCNKLISVMIPNKVTSIEASAFRYCYSLTSIMIPIGVTNIGSSAFDSCLSATSVSIFDGVTKIDTNAFSYCYGVKEYHFLSATPPTLVGTSIFYSIPSDCVIYVPVGSAEAYKTATNWTTVADHIQEEPA